MGMGMGMVIGIGMAMAMAMGMATAMAMGKVRMGMGMENSFVDPRKFDSMKKSKALRKWTSLTTTIAIPIPANNRTIAIAIHINNRTIAIAIHFTLDHRQQATLNSCYQFTT